MDLKNAACVAYAALTCPPACHLLAFAGPGLAVRVIGDVTDGGKLDILRDVDEIFINTIREYGLYDEIWQVSGWTKDQGTRCVSTDGLSIHA